MNRSEAGIVPYSNAIFSGPVDFGAPIPIASVRGKTIIVTGGASGLGAGFSTEWAKLGANIIIGDLNEKAGTALIAQLRKISSNDNHHFIKLNVLDWPQHAAFFKQAASLSPHGGIDCVVANAGVADGLESAIYEDPPDYSTMDKPPLPQLRISDVNLQGVLYTANLAFSYLSRNPGSQKCSTSPSKGPRDRHLILISSIAGIAPLPTQSLYTASKHGVAGLFRSLRITQPITNGIRVNMISPYFVNTPILGGGGSLVLAGGGMAQIEDVVEAATRLVADKGIIGRALVIGSQGYAEQLLAAGLESPPALKKYQAIWDVYGEDFEQTDLFIRRVIGLTNLVTSIRGWTGFFVDIGLSLTAPLRGIFGTNQAKLDRSVKED